MDNQVKQQTLSYPSLVLSDPDGNVWKEQHLKCSTDEMLPTINENSAGGPSWWWYCDTCKYFVRPLKPAELAIVNNVLKKALDKKKQHNFGKRRRAVPK